MKSLVLILLIASSLSITDREIWNYLKSNGPYNNYGTAGLMGNLFAESGLAPNNLENRCNTKLGLSDTEYTNRVNNGQYTNFVHDGCGYGLAQWTYYSRKQNLLNKKKSAGTSIGDGNTQLAFLISELKSDFSSVHSTLKSATSVRSASDVVLTKFEKPADQSESVKKLRASYGQKYYDQFA